MSLPRFVPTAAALAFALGAFSSLAAPATGLPAASRLLQSQPVSFEPNVGQLHGQVRFFSRSARHTLFLTEQEAVVSLAVPGAPPVLRMRLAGSRRRASIEGLDPLPATTSYILGSHSEQWRAGVPRFARVRYAGVYPGIDLLFYGNGLQLEYDFVVSPGADPARIRLRFTGSEPLRLDTEGNLRLRVGGVPLSLSRPLVYQKAQDGSRIPVPGSYRLLSAHEVGFSVASWNHSLPLVIDPVLAYSTFLGGGGVDVATAVAVDPAGNIWVAGHTSSPRFPVSAEPAQDALKGPRDIFLSKFDPSRPPAESLLFSTYLGGSGDDRPTAIALDGAGNLYLAGHTSSADFPKATVEAGAGANQNVLVARFNAAQPGPEGLLFATQFGGGGSDLAHALALGAGGKVIVAGYTASQDFRTAGSPLQGANRGGWDGLIAVVNTEAAPADSLEYSSYYGGASTDVITAIARDASGKIYLAGFTMSDDLPVTDQPYQREPGGGGDAFLTRLDLIRPGLDALEYGTYLGGAALDIPYAMNLDAVGNIWLAGYTLSENFPTAGSPFQASRLGLTDVFLSRMNLSLPPAESLTYSTYLGGGDVEVAYGMTLDATGNLYVTGYTFSDDFPTRGGPVQPARGGASDAFLFRLNPALPADQALVYSTYLGGSSAEAAYAVALDAAGNIHLAGFTQSANFPLTDPTLQGQLDGLWNSFLATMDLRR